MCRQPKLHEWKTYHCSSPDVARVSNVFTCIHCFFEVPYKNAQEYKIDYHCVIGFNSVSVYSFDYFQSHSHPDRLNTEICILMFGKCSFYILNQIVTTVNMSTIKLCARN